MPRKVSTEPKKPKKQFVIPTIQEVSDFMYSYMIEKKKNWPKAFCDWYAEKFWHAYNSSEWRLSAGKGGKVKNWQSCFKNNWQTLKWECVEMLQTLTPKPKPVDQATLEYMNEILDAYRKHPETMTEDTLASCYLWLKEQGFTKRLNKDQQQQAIVDSKEDVKKGRITAVKFIFDSMVKQLLTFDYFFNEAPK